MDDKREDCGGEDRQDGIGRGKKRSPWGGRRKRKAGARRKLGESKLQKEVNKSTAPVTQVEVRLVD